MNIIKSYKDFLLEYKSEEDIVKDLARHLSFDKDVIKYLNTSRSRRKIGWRELLRSKLHGSNLDYITYITKKMVAHYNPQITGPTITQDEEDREFIGRKNKFMDMSLADQIDDLNDRVTDIEDTLGIDPDDPDTVDKAQKELKEIGFEPDWLEDNEEE